jgi:hypothetical protein
MRDDHDLLLFSSLPPSAPQLTGSVAPIIPLMNEAAEFTDEPSVFGSGLRRLKK